MELLRNTLHTFMHPATRGQAESVAIFWLVVGITTVVTSIYFIFKFLARQSEDPIPRLLLWSFLFIICPFVAPLIYLLFYERIYALPKNYRPPSRRPSAASLAAVKRSTPIVIPPLASSADAATQTLLHALGDLHDSRVTSLYWDVTNRILTLHIDDFFSNFLGLPEYPGNYPGPLVFHGISDLALDYTHSDKTLWIDDLSIIQSPHGLLSVTLLLIPAGRITFNSTRFTLPRPIEIALTQHLIRRT